MGGEGSISTMISSLKYTTSLLKGRGKFKNKRDMYLDVEKDYVNHRPMTPEERTALKRVIAKRLRKRTIIDIVAFSVALLVVITLILLIV